MNLPKHQPQAPDALKERTQLSDMPPELRGVPLVHRSAALIVIRLDGLNVVACSGNIPTLLERAEDQIIGSSLAEVLPQLAQEVSATHLSEDREYHALDFTLIHCAQALDAIVHRQNAFCVIDFLPVSRRAGLMRKTSMRLASKARTQILRARSIESARDIAADTIRAITGFDSTTIFHIAPDHAPEIIADSSTKHTKFIARDKLQDLNIAARLDALLDAAPWWSATAFDAPPVEITTQTEYAPDLSFSLGRSAPAALLKTLQDTGAEASFAYRLRQEDRDFGLVVGMSTAPEALEFDDWYLLDEIGATLMLRQTQAEQDQITEKIWRLRRVENRFAGAMRHNDAIEDVIPVLIPILKGLLGAEGFAFQYRSELFLSGQTPPPAFIDALINWATEEIGAETQFSSVKLHETWAPAQGHIDTACGVLIQPIMLTSLCRLVWFRGPQQNTPASANSARTKSQATQKTSSHLPGMPAAWAQQRATQSIAWQVSELRSAQKVFAEYLEVLAAQFALKEENLALRQFAERAAHDLNEPLRGISMALNIMEEENFEEEVVRLTHGLAAGSAHRLTHLTSDLLEFAVLDATRIAFEMTDLGPVCQNTIDLLTPQIEELGAIVSLGPLPAWPVQESMITRLFLNLLGNALKYAHPDRHPQIDVSVLNCTPNLLQIAVSDNGLGIPVDSAVKIFEPLQRLHRHDQIEGSGLGLNICSDIVAAHNGSIKLDCDYEPGARFVFTLGKRA